MNIFSISFTLVFVDEVHEGIGREDRRIHFVTSEEGTLTLIGDLVCFLSLHDDSEQRSEGIQNWSC